MLPLVFTGVANFSPRLEPGDGWGLATNVPPVRLCEELCSEATQNLRTLFFAFRIFPGHLCAEAGTQEGI
ncbi:MAG: hypothetical protein BGO67_09975 [Alphaproteobacteria bacterium 41-28]|nr:MAG: hypothetical protein BGO67_09975 [Alphaproteobacteria bacterium 41-28]